MRLGQLTTFLFGTQSFSSAFYPNCYRLSQVHQDPRYFNERKRNLVVLSSTNNKFDLSKPSFDLFSARFIRSDALLQYNSLNQSEPLRINIYFILAIGLFSYPSLSEAVFGEEAQLSLTALSCLGGIGSVVLFLRECRNRVKQLLRIEKEMNAESLTVRLSTINKFDERIYGNQPVVTLKELQGKRRILALTGSIDLLNKITIQLRVFRRRLAQAGTIVIILPKDSSDDLNWVQLNINEFEIRADQWLAQIEDVEGWKKYFDDLVEEETNELIWFGLNFNGRSFASGIGVEPNIFQMLGQNLRPLDFIFENSQDSISSYSIIDETRPFTNIKKCQEDFYLGLTKGDKDMVNNIYNMNIAEEVSEIVASGGRLDDWSSCLVDGSRPEGMRISDSDFLIVSSTLAYSTCIEFPSISSEDFDSTSGTLLAIQRWARNNEQEDWKLQLHQTIPWTVDKKAGGLLMCDSRGCVALTRSKEQQTFGGLIG